jgi:2'-5' RNA ligase
MSFFLGIFPDKESRNSIGDVSEEIKSVFEGFDIPVRWSNPDNYHLTMVHFGERFPFYKRLFLKYKIRKLEFKKFVIKFNTVKLGLTRKYKELIYLDVLEGGDNMRTFLLELRSMLNIKNEGNFLPHLTIGRVSKELTDQEYSNICKDLSVVTKGLGIKNIGFEVNSFDLVKNKDGEYQVLMNFKEFSNTSS